MTDLPALIARVEALTGPCRETDAAIAAALRLGRNLPDWAARWTGEWRPTIQGSVVLMQDEGKPGPHFVSLAYTASIDAAMTLVDPSWWFRCSGPMSPAAYGYSREDQRTPCAGVEMIGEPYSAGGRGHNLACAITVACLRALSTAPTGRG